MPRLEGRHLKLGAIFAMMSLLSTAVGLYLWVAFHHGHVWSLILVSTLHFAALFSPAFCFGYNTEDPQFLLSGGGMDEQTFLNCRDLGWIGTVVFFLLSFVVPASAWYASDGTAPPMMGVVCEYVGNACMGWAYVLWLRIFVF